MIYTVFSTTDTPYMNWQSDLLEYSWKEAGQPGELIRLVGTYNPESLPTHTHARVFRTWPWDVHPITGDHYPVYNKPASFSQWLSQEQPEGTVLLIDPDCVFRSPIIQEVKEGYPVAQEWVNFHQNIKLFPPEMNATFEVLKRFCRKNLNLVKGVMIPTLIHTKDLKRIIGRWLELTALIRQGARRSNGKPLWESDMFGYVIAAAEFGLIHEPGNLGICTNWLPEDAPNSPMIHYCQSIKSTNDEIMWDKKKYRPWENGLVPNQAKYDYGRDFLKILNRFIDTQAKKTDQFKKDTVSNFLRS